MKRLQLHLITEIHKQWTLSLDKIERNTQGKTEERTNFEGRKTRQLQMLL